MVNGQHSKLRHGIQSSPGDAVLGQLIMTESQTLQAVEHSQRSWNISQPVASQICNSDGGTSSPQGIWQGT